MDALNAAQFEEISILIQRKWGQQALQTVRAFQATQKRAVIPTGFPDLDTAIGTGGIACGEITLLEGNPTSGMTTLGYRLIASAQAQNMVSVYLDLAHSFDADYAIRQCGVSEERLLLVYPDDLAHALALARDVVPLPYSGVIVVDAAITQTDSLFRGLSESLSRLKPLLRQSRWALLVLLSQDGRGSTLPSSLHLRVKRTGWHYTDDLLSGLSATVAIIKNIHHPATNTAPIVVEFGDDLS